MDTQEIPLSLDDVKLAIYRQHTQLGQLLDELEANADSVVAKGGDGKVLRHSLDALHVRFMRHLAYEEAHLTPNTVLGDHVEQRVRMRGLVHDRDVFADPRDLAREARAFIHLLRRDLTEEDAKLRALR